MNWNEVHEAFVNNDLRRLTALLSQSPNTPDNALHPDDEGPIASAVFLGLLHRLGHGFKDLSRHESEKLTLEAVTSLLRLGCDPMTRNEWGQSALHILTMKYFAYDFNQFIDILISFVEKSDRTSYANAMDGYGHSAIFYANDRYDSTNRVNRLLDFGADPFMEDPTGATILRTLLRRLHTHNAQSEEESLHVIVRLLQLGCDRTIPDERGQTTLHILAKNHNGYNFNKVARTLISYIHESERASYINATDADGKSAIWYASRSYFACDRVTELLDCGADPCVGGYPFGSSVLHRLIQCIDSRNHQKSLQVMTRLIQLGCDPKAQDRHGRTALHMLAQNHTEIDFRGFTTGLISYSDEWERSQCLDTTDADGKSAIFYAVERDDAINRVNALLDFGADASVTDLTGASILHKVFRGRLPCHEEDTATLIVRLLQLGCSPIIRDQHGQTALHIMAQNYRIFDCGRFMIALLSFVDEWEQSSYVNATDSYGKSAIFYALECHILTHRFKTLVDFGADTDLRDMTGSTLVHAVFRSHFPCRYEETTYLIITLLQRGCDLQAQDEQGQTALHILAMSCGASSFDRYVEILIPFLDEWERASYINATDTDGNSALFYAAGSYEGYRKVGRLLQLGADPNIRGKDGQTPLHRTALNTWRDASFNQLSLLLQHGADPTMLDNNGYSALNYLGSGGYFSTTLAFLLLRSMVGAGYLPTD